MRIDGFFGKRAIHGFWFLLVALVFIGLPACTTASASSDYLLQDRENRLVDSFHATRAYCKSIGRVIVVEQNRTEICSVRVRRANGGVCPPRLGDKVRGCAR